MARIRKVIYVNSAEAKARGKGVIVQYHAEDWGVIRREECREVIINGPSRVVQQMAPQPERHIGVHVYVETFAEVVCK